MLPDDEAWEGDWTAPQFEPPLPPAELRLGPDAMVDHFRIVRPIGRGGMGELYVARDTELGRRVALKVIRDERVTSERAVAAFLEEARTTARFNHPHIVTIYAVGRAKTGPLPSGTPYLALEYLEGQDLSKRLAQRQPSLQEALRIAIAVARALEEAHRHGVLHLDLKPANVFVARDGRPRVLDFGLAKVHAVDDPVHDSADDTKRKRVWGTPNYMAPEQWRAEPLTAATDVWALGMMVFEMLVDELPFDQGSVEARSRSVTSDKPAPRVDVHCMVPTEVADLVARCLEKKPQRRPNASELAEALQEMLQGPRRAVSLEQNPFRGLLPFTQRHAEFFYGREEETVAFVERMRMQPVLPVVGPSGAGKSSFVHAGVIPRVREQDLWIVLRLRPGTRPFHALAARLVHSDTGTITIGVDAARSSMEIRDTPPPPAAGDVEGLVERLRTAPRRLSLELRDLAEYRGAKVLLVVDQLEELFTLVDDAEERARFMEAVCTAADDPADPVRVVFTVRDDFLGRLVTGPEVRDALAQVTLVQPLGPNELEQVLERPAEALGYRFEAGLVAEMVGEVSRETSGLPLLQFAAHRLWEERDKQQRLIVHSAYRAMGGVAGALAQHADGVVDSLSEDDLRIARELCLRLVTPERTRKVVPKSEALDGLEPAAAEAVLASLIAARLVSARRAPLADAPSDNDVVRIELVHESLIDKWRTLGRWLDESQEGLAFLAEAGQAARLWDKRGRRPEEVWQGAALEDALRKLAQCRTEVPERVRDFLREGQARRERHARRRRLLVAGVMGISLLVAATAVAIAFYVAHKEREALAEKDRALAERAEALLESAREALAQRQVLEARAKLRDALTVQDSASGRALWWQLSAEPLVWSRELGTLIYDAAFSADGQTVAVASHDKNVHLFDATTGATRMLRGHTDQVWSVAAGGPTLVSGSWNGELALWDAGRGDVTRLIRAHGDAVNDLDVSRDGRIVASASSDRTAALWDAQSGVRKQTLSHPTEVSVVALSFDGNIVATGTPNGQLRLWRRGSSASRQLAGHDDAVLAVDISPDGALLASASADNTVRLWRTDTGALTKTLRGHRASVRTVAFCTKELVASGANDGSVRLWKLPSGRTVATLSGHTGGVRGLATSADGHYLSSLARDFVVRMWDVRVSAEHAPSTGHSAWVYAATFSPDGKTVASASMDRTIGLWDVESGEQRHLLEGHTGGVHDVAFSPNGELLASAGLDQTARLWDLKSGAELRVLRGHRGTLRNLGFSPDGRTLATAGGDGTVRLWDVERGGELTVLRGHIGDVFEASFDRSGEFLATAGNDGNLVLWRTGSWTKESVLEHGTPVRGAAFSPVSNTLATATDDGDVFVWDLTTRTSTKIGHHEGRVYHLSFDPAGEHIGAPSSNGVGVIHSLADPKKSVALRGHRSEVNTLRFSPDGKLALTSSDDGTLRLWETATGRPRWRAPALLAREGTSPVLLTHRGWLTPAVGGPRPTKLAKTSWRSAIEERALLVDAHGETLCVQTYDGGVELWDRQRDALLARAARKGLRQLAATPHGCVALSDEGAAWLHPEHGLARLVTAEPPTAVGLGRSSVYVAAGRELHAFTLGTERGDRTAHTRYRSSIGVTAIVEMDDAIAVGYRDGNVEAIPLDASAGRAVPHFEQVPESPVVRLIAGPMTTLVVGYANGLIGLWSQRDGRRLMHARLHGQVVHMLISDRRLYAATDLGHQLVWDLGAFYRERCELLREIWERVPVVWEYGAPVRRPAPEDHPCALDAKD